MHARMHARLKSAQQMHRTSELTCSWEMEMVSLKQTFFLTKCLLNISKRQTKGCKCSRCTGRRAGNRMMMRVMMMMVMMMTMTAYHSHVVFDDADESGGGDHGDDKSHRFVWHNLKVGWL